MIVGKKPIEHVFLFAVGSITLPFLMKKYAEAFYKSKIWQTVRANYLKQSGGLCEECLKKGIYKAAVEVHHKIHITPLNIDDPSVTLNYDNLIGLCRECHRKKHSKSRRYTIDEYGRVTPL